LQAPTNENRRPGAYKEKEGKAMRTQTTILASVIAAGLALASGCDNGARPSLRDDFEELSRERTELKRRVEQLESENKELTGRVSQLAAMSPEARLEVMPDLVRIELGRRTGVFDSDEDGRKDKLIVYVRPYDKTADTIKAAGSIRVQLWDLNADADSAQVAQIAQWDIGGAQLKQYWAGTFLTNYYRLTFDLGELLVGHEGELTLNVTFIDYITGKVLTAQKVLKP
jgi:outer membrane murein-binding lipoprotein Lpp